MIIKDYLHWVAIRDHAVDAKTAAIQLGVTVVSRSLAIACFALACGPAFVVVKSLDAEKPVNVPTYESALPESRKICREPVVESKPDLWATDVVVVRQDGDTVRMDTTEAWSRIESPEDSDDVWVVGICAEDIVDPATYREPDNDNIVDVTFE